MASKEEVLGRCLEELDRCQAIIQKQEEDMKDKDRTIESLKTRLADQSHSEKGKNKTSSHGYVPGRSDSNKAELAPSCKITMAAKASHT
ncbi:hypothetical protein M9434_006161 [Picochlorum sp. BPE23]|nr:hypothetical protein M9434_006161 [Picochlorum sp. BPE23]